MLSPTVLRSHLLDTFVTFSWTFPKSAEIIAEKMPRGPSGGTGDNSMTFLVTFWSQKGDILDPPKCTNCLKCKKVHKQKKHAQPLPRSFRAASCVPQPRRAQTQHSNNTNQQNVTHNSKLGLGRPKKNQ